MAFRFDSPVAPGGGAFILDAPSGFGTSTQPADAAFGVVTGAPAATYHPPGTQGQPNDASMAIVTTAPAASGSVPVSATNATMGVATTAPAATSHAPLPGAVSALSASLALVTTLPFAAFHAPGTGFARNPARTLRLANRRIRALGRC